MGRSVHAKGLSYEGVSKRQTDISFITQVYHPGRKMMELSLNHWLSHNRFVVKAGLESIEIDKLNTSPK